MNRTYLRRIAALEAKFPPPLPDWRHLNIDELHDLKMLLVRALIGKYKKSGAQLLPWISEALDSETPKQRAAVRKAAGLKRQLTVFYGTPQLVPNRGQPDAADRKPEVQSSPNLLIESARRILWSPTTMANGRRGARGNRRQHRASG